MHWSSLVTAVAFRDFLLVPHRPGGAALPRIFSDDALVVRLHLRRLVIKRMPCRVIRRGKGACMRDSETATAGKNFWLAVVALSTLWPSPKFPLATWMASNLCLPEGTFCTVRHWPDHRERDLAAIGNGSAFAKARDFAA